MDLLLIDDNEFEAKLTIRALSRNNPSQKIHYMKDSEEALKMLTSPMNETFPKVILLDLKMPRLNGLEMLKLLKSNERCRVIPVVMLTSSKEQSDIHESYHSGVNAYVVKPVDSEEFTNTVSEVGLFWLTLNNPVSL